MTIQPEQNESLIENGTYQATLTDVFRFTNSFGQRIGFEFTLHGRNIEGRTITRTTTTKLADKSKLGETVKALARRNEPTLQSLESLIGTRCILLIVQQRNRQGKSFNSVDRIFYSMKLT